MRRPHAATCVYSPCVATPSATMRAAPNPAAPPAQAMFVRSPSRTAGTGYCEPHSGQIAPDGPVVLWHPGHRSLPWACPASATPSVSAPAAASELPQFAQKDASCATDTPHCGQKLAMSSGEPTGPEPRKRHHGEDAHRGTASPETVRHCLVCDAPLVGKRPHATFCSARHRAEAARLRAILSGSEAAPFRSLPERRARARKRTNGSP